MRLPLPNLRDESGFALIMALGSLLMLSVVLTVALEVGRTGLSCCTP